MLEVCEETVNFVRACEAIHDRLAKGDILSPDDRNLIIFNGSELLSTLIPV